MERKKERGKGEGREREGKEREWIPTFFIQIYAYEVGSPPSPLQRLYNTRVNDWNWTLLILPCLLVFGL